MLKIEQLAELLEQNRAAAQARVKEFSIGGKPFHFNSQPAIMGVINLSPDSWYRESVGQNAAQAVQRARVLQSPGRPHHRRGGGVQPGRRRARG